MIDALITPLTQTFFQKALLGGLLVSTACGVVGSLVVLRRMAFLGDALSHAMIAGVAGGYLFMKLFFGIEAHAPAMLIGSVLAAILTVLLIGFVSKASRIKEDAAIGIMYCGIFAAGVVVVSVFRNYIHIDIMHFIMGDILGVSDADLWSAAIVTATVLSVIILFFRHFQVTSFDPIMAASIGISVLAVDYLLTACVSLVVVSAVSMVGVILVIGLLITPASTAYLLSDKLPRMMFLSVVFGATSVIGGLYLSVWLDSAGGGAVVLFSTLQFLIVFIFAPRYGLLSDYLRKKKIIPQELMEDILQSVLRFNKSEVPIADIQKYVTPNRMTLKRALSLLQEQGAISIRSDLVTLTEKGQNMAEKVLRAHRIWEAYLDHVGHPQDSIHQTAHSLEHIASGEDIEYLHEKIGKPDKDPHGSDIK
jgi:ABC-type Mn2+/Zn2+ transport system permease subunit/Mn-dependent DtxR family transcriptional regulator